MAEMEPLAPNTFFCIDGHTCGNPVRLVAAGGPRLDGADMSEKRQDFLARYDWIRTALMFEPRGHDMMSGALLYPPTQSGAAQEADTAILFIETSGCLPMCGHGTIGAVTFAVERGLVQPRDPGRLRLETPAGPVEALYRLDERGFVEAVRITNVPSFLAVEGLEVDCPELGRLRLDIAYGGNFYAIVEPQTQAGKDFQGLDALTPGDILRLSPLLRRSVNAAVVYGDRAIDRSPCGTGTSARMAQLAARGELAVGDCFRHESIIGSLFTGRIEATADVGGRPAILPSIEGWARMTGLNTLFVEPRDPYAHGFQVV